MPPTAFPLGRVFEDRPAARLELDRVVPTADTVMPYFWVYDPDGGAVLAALEVVGELRSIDLMDDLGDRGLFRATWDPDYLGIMAAVAETGVSVLSAGGTSEGWSFEFHAPSVEYYAAFQQYCDDHDLDATLARLHHLSAPTTDAGGRYGLTPEQCEALVAALEQGYYEEPRETDLAALAAQFDITRQAFAARLRRGYRNLVRSTLVPQSHDAT